VGPRYARAPRRRDGSAAAREAAPPRICRHGGPTHDTTDKKCNF
jgi:hypothetical protein